jgi:exopolyphosphatase/pppGpp-phosphohydrolase
MLCEEFGRGRRHASKVLELSIELVEKLSSLNVLRLGLDTERALYIAALLHDIGVCWSADDSHREYTYRALLTHEKELNSTCSCDLTKKVATIAKLHGVADPVPIDMDRETKVAIGIIRIADGLDYTLNQTVEEIDRELESNTIKLRVLCRGRWSCRTGVAKTLKKKTLLEEVLGLKIWIEEVVQVEC